MTQVYNWRCHTRNSWRHFRRTWKIVWKSRVWYRIHHAFSSRSTSVEKYGRKETDRSIHIEYFRTTRGTMSMFQELRTCREWEHQSYQSELCRLQVLDILSNFTATKSISPSTTNTIKFKYRNLANFLALSSHVLHFLLLTLMTRLSSVGLISKIPILNVPINGQEFIVFVLQSDNIASVSIQRGESSFDPSTSSSQSSRLSQMGCFSADKPIAKRLLSTCLVLGKTKCARRLSKSVNQTCHIAAQAVSSPWRMLSWTLMSTIAARVRSPVPQDWTMRKLQPSKYCGKLFWFSSNSNSKDVDAFFRSSTRHLAPMLWYKLAVIRTFQWFRPLVLVHDRNLNQWSSQQLHHPKRKLVKVNATCGCGEQTPQYDCAHANL